MGFISEKLKKYDKAVIGAIVASLLPIVGFLLSYLIKNFSGRLNFEAYLNIAMYDNYLQEQQDILILSMIPNMLLFYFTNFRWGFYEFTKGLVGITILLGLGLVLLCW